MKEVETDRRNSQQELHSPRSYRSQNTQRTTNENVNANNSLRHSVVEIEKPPTPYDDRVIPTLRHNPNKNQKTERSDRELNENPLAAEEDNLNSNNGNTSSSEAVVPESGKIMILRIYNGRKRKNASLVGKSIVIGTIRSGIVG